MVSAEDAIRICEGLQANGIHLWLTGGWGIDALIREQSRPHKDLDIITLVDDVSALCKHLGRDGYTLKELWSENLWDVDADGSQIATAFVLHDASGREVDVHAMRLDDRGRGIPAWDAEGRIFEKQDLSGEGLIGGFSVQCLSPEMQMLCHSGYELPTWQLPDLELLHQEFGVEYPDELFGRLASV